MAEVTVEESSWLNMVNLLNFGDITFWDAVVFPEIPENPDDTFKTLTQDEARRIDLLSYDFYGDVGYAWVILLVNDLHYPTQLREGMLIRLPSLDTIKSYLTVNNS